MIPKGNRTRGTFFFSSFFPFRFEVCAAKWTSRKQVLGSLVSLGHPFKPPGRLQCPSVWGREKGFCAHVNREKSRPSTKRTGSCSCPGNGSWGGNPIRTRLQCPPTSPPPVQFSSLTCRLGFLTVSTCWPPPLSWPLSSSSASSS